MADKNGKFTSSYPSIRRCHELNCSASACNHNRPIIMSAPSSPPPVRPVVYLDEVTQKKKYTTKGLQDWPLEESQVGSPGHTPMRKARGKENMESEVRDKTLLQFDDSEDSDRDDPTPTLPRDFSTPKREYTTYNYEVERVNLKEVCMRLERAKDTLKECITPVANRTYSIPFRPSIRQDVHSEGTDGHGAQVDSHYEDDRHIAGRDEGDFDKSVGSHCEDKDGRHIADHGGDDGVKDEKRGAENKRNDEDEHKKDFVQADEQVLKEKKRFEQEKRGFGGEDQRRRDVYGQNKAYKHQKEHRNDEEYHDEHDRTLQNQDHVVDDEKDKGVFHRKEVQYEVEKGHIGIGEGSQKQREVFCHQQHVVQQRTGEYGNDNAVQHQRDYGVQHQRVVQRQAVQQFHQHISVHQHFEAAFTSTTSKPFSSTTSKLFTSTISTSANIKQHYIRILKRIYCHRVDLLIQDEKEAQITGNRKMELMVVQKKKNVVCELSDRIQRFKDECKRKKYTQSDIERMIVQEQQILDDLEKKVNGLLEDARLRNEILQKKRGQRAMFLNMNDYDKFIQQRTNDAPKTSDVATSARMPTSFPTRTFGKAGDDESSSSTLISNGNVQAAGDKRGSALDQHQQRGSTNQHYHSMERPTASKKDQDLDSVRSDAEVPNTSRSTQYDIPSIEMDPSEKVEIRTLEPPTGQIRSPFVQKWLDESVPNVGLSEGTVERNVGVDDGTVEQNVGVDESKIGMKDKLSKIESATERLVKDSGAQNLRFNKDVESQQLRVDKDSEAKNQKLTKTSEPEPSTQDQKLTEPLEAATSQNSSTLKEVLAREVTFITDTANKARSIVTEAKPKVSAEVSTDRTQYKESEDGLEVNAEGRESRSSAQSGNENERSGSESVLLEPPKQIEVPVLNLDFIEQTVDSLYEAHLADLKNQKVEEHEVELKEKDEKSDEEVKVIEDEEEEQEKVEENVQEAETGRSKSSVFSSLHTDIPVSENLDSPKVEDSLLESVEERQSRASEASGSHKRRRSRIPQLRLRDSSPSSSLQTPVESKESSTPTNFQKSRIPRRASVDGRQQPHSSSDATASPPKKVGKLELEKKDSGAESLKFKKGLEAEKMKLNKDSEAENLTLMKDAEDKNLSLNKASESVPSTHNQKSESALSTQIQKPKEPSEVRGSENLSIQNQISTESSDTASTARSSSTEAKSQESATVSTNRTQFSSTESESGAEFNAETGRGSGSSGQSGNGNGGSSDSIQEDLTTARDSDSNTAQESHLNTARDTDSILDISLSTAREADSFTARDLSTTPSQRSSIPSSKTDSGVSTLSSPRIFSVSHPSLPKSPIERARTVWRKKDNNTVLTASINSSRADDSMVHRGEVTGKSSLVDLVEANRVFGLERKDKMQVWSTDQRVDVLVEYFTLSFWKEFVVRYAKALVEMRMIDNFKDVKVNTEFVEKEVTDPDLLDAVFLIADNVAYFMNCAVLDQQNHKRRTGELHMAFTDLSGEKMVQYVQKQMHKFTQLYPNPVARSPLELTAFERRIEHQTPLELFQIDYFKRKLDEYDPPHQPQFKL
ncbi:unnamed protein product [Bursaphelenchus okinawaensis]|uniref:Uncharacterized protein n=1 Tax=Bursaphelenchus okinawaensis TaxID=465554 RepID=A0A811LKQ6_9BILA|nr:unnamed protein product [Bursaphelenchus okinawaensis]CAG9127595.1 unnamed protein product [Bursaphelenchus okinawaensis]